MLLFFRISELDINADWVSSSYTKCVLKFMKLCEAFLALFCSSSDSDGSTAPATKYEYRISHIALLSCQCEEREKKALNYQRGGGKLARKKNSSLEIDEESRVFRLECTKSWQTVFDFFDEFMCHFAEEQTNLFSPLKVIKRTIKYALRFMICYTLSFVRSRSLCSQSDWLVCDVFNSRVA